MVVRRKLLAHKYSNTFILVNLQVKDISEVNKSVSTYQTLWDIVKAVLRGVSAVLKYTRNRGLKSIIKVLPQKNKKNYLKQI